ncbi:hypothetical protein D3C75_1031190 [compost metagenome]
MDVYIVRPVLQGRNLRMRKEMDALLVQICKNSPDEAVWVQLRVSICKECRRFAEGILPGKLFRCQIVHLKAIPAECLVFVLQQCHIRFDTGKVQACPPDKFRRLIQRTGHLLQSVYGFHTYMIELHRLGFADLLHKLVEHDVI